MSILTNEYVKYDTVEHFYYLTEAGIDQYTGYAYLLDIWKNPKSRLKKMGRLLHTFYTESYHNTKPKYYKHRELIEYKIFNNEFGERQAIINALTLMVEFEEDSPSWFKQLLMGEIEWPLSIRKMLKSANVLVYGEMSGIVPEDEYEVGY